MKDIQKMIKVKKPHELVLLVLLVIYIVFDVQVPQQMKGIFGNAFGIVAVCLVSMYVFAKCNKTLGVLGIVATYFLIKRCKSKFFAIH